MLFPKNAQKTAFFHRIIPIFICILVVISLFPFQASADTVDGLGLELLQAIERGNTDPTITVPVGVSAVDSLLAQTFSKYPALFYYYNGYNSTGNNARTQVTFHLTNTHIPWEQVYIAHSLEDVKNIMFYSLSRFDEGFHFVMVGGPTVTADHIGDFADRLRVENNLSFMGYHGNSISYVQSTVGNLVRYDVTFTMWEGVSRSTMAQWRDAAEQKAIQLANSLFAQDMPDYRKELLIHDWLVNNCRYNTQDTSAPISHVAYSGLVSGNPVCQGYAEAALILFQAAGIPIDYVPGDGTNSSGKTESHAWNCVQIQGQWYMLDITWDDPTSQGGVDTLRYDYFNLTSSALASDHTWVQSDFPRCTATAMNYNTVRSLVDSDYNRYTDYSDRNLATRAKCQAQYGPLLEICPKPGQSSTPPAYTQPEEPAYTTPNYTSPNHTQPGNTVPGYTSPDFTRPGNSTTPGYSVPNFTQPTTYPSQSSTSDGIGGIIAAILAAIAGVIGAIFGIFKKRKSPPPREERPFFDPSDYYRR